MTLADLRRLAIRRQASIRFRLPGLLECVVDVHGVARIPGLKNAPDFDLEHELSAASEFWIEPAGADRGAAQHLQRTGLAELLASLPAAPQP